MGIVQPSQSTVVPTLNPLIPPSVGAKGQWNTFELLAQQAKSKPPKKQKENQSQSCSYLGTHCTWGINVENGTFR